MRVLVSGASGLVGSALVPHLASHGHEVGRLVRRAGQDAGEVQWDPTGESVDASALAGYDAIVHLAGENIASGRWNAEKKDRIRESRVRGTRLLAEAAAKATDGPRTFVCASAIGYYGDRGDEPLTEDSAAGTGFLADVCADWEEACAPAREAGVRVCNARIGVVLSPDGGALKKMLLPFKLMLGGKIGSGQQWMSWIAIDDVVSALRFLLENDALQGAFNLTAPNPARNVDFTRTLGRVLKRFTPLPMPAFAARLVFGEMADALLLASAAVQPQRLADGGFAFAHAELEGALRHVLDR